MNKTRLFGCFAAALLLSAGATAQENKGGIDAQMLQELRDWYGKSLEVSSWYRTKSFNESCGGSSDSAHLDGLATDINNIPESKYGEFKTAWEVICKNHGKIGGCNYYNWGMHFCSDEGRFGNKKFTVRDYRK